MSSKLRFFLDTTFSGARLLFVLLAVVVAFLVLLAPLVDPVKGSSLTDWLLVIVPSVGTGIAVYVPWRINDEAERRQAIERAVQAKVLAVIMAPELKNLNDRWRVAVNALSGMSGQVTALVVQSTLKTAALRVPDTFIDALPQLHFFGDPLGATFAQLIAFLRRYEKQRKEILKIADTYLPGILYDALSLKGELVERAWKIGKLIEDADREIESIHDFQPK